MHRLRRRRIFFANCPAGPLLHQWEGEMRQRFGLRFRPLDAAALQKIKYETELGANPFDHVALGIVSIDFAKQEKVLTDIERSHFDIVIIDEAHHCTSLGTAGDREDSQRRKLAEVLAERADALLLLTATPHDRNDPHFASLIELLDRSLLDGKGALRGERYRNHVVRQLKRHIKDPVTGDPRFRERIVIPERVTFDHCPRYAEFQYAMLALIVPPLKRALKKRAFGDALAFIALLKRSVSSARAAASTIKVVLDRLDELTKKQGELQEERKQRIRTLRDLVRRRERFGTLSHEEEQDQPLLEAEDIAAEIAEAGSSRALVEVSEWNHLLAQDRALPPARVWENHFKSWARVTSPEARTAAEKAFGKLADEFVLAHVGAMEAERIDLAAWLRLRTREICGEVKATTRNLDLFGPREPDVPRWQLLTDDVERLCAFALDTAHTARQRAEANTVVKINAERKQRIERREKTDAARVLPLGMLLLVPADTGAKKGGRHGA